MMGKKVQRMFTSMLVLFTLSTTTVAASSLWGSYEGNSKVRVMINSVEKQFSSSDVPGLLINGATVLPLRTISDSLQALVKWDNSNKTVSVFKPNVHMFVAEGISNDYSVKTPFGVVKQGATIDFVVFPQVDNLQTTITSMKISIESPNGSNVVTPFEKSMYGHKDSFWHPYKFTNVTFSESGIYTVKLSMQLEEGGEYQIVSEKQIVSK